MDFDRPELRSILLRSSYRFVKARGLAVLGGCDTLRLYCALQLSSVVMIASRISNYVMIVALLSWSLVAYAQESSPSRGEQQRFANERINEAVNTTTLFASQDVLATGKFTKQRIDQPDTRYAMLRAPFEKRFAEPADRWQPYVYGSGALLRVSSGATKPVGSEGEDDFSTSKLFSLATGGGTYLRVSDDLRLAASVAVAYSYLQNRYDFNNTFSRDVLLPDDGLFYNWNLHVLTYSPTVRALYEHRWGELLLNATLAYSQLFNDSIHSSSQAINIDSASGVMWMRTAVTQPLGIEAFGGPVALRPFFQWSNISGKAADGLNLVNLFEMGADVVLNFEQKFLFFSQMYWGGSYVTGDSFEGYHIGFGGKF